MEVCNDCDPLMTKTLLKQESVVFLYLSAVCTENDVRIIIGDAEEYYRGDKDIVGENYIADSLAVGRVEVCLAGSWRRICRQTWSMEDAAVACSQLGFSRAGG